MPKQSRIDELMTKMKEILKNRKLTKNDVDNIDQIEKEITKEVADKECEKFERVLGDLESNTNTNIWKEMRKSLPQELQASSNRRSQHTK